MNDDFAMKIKKKTQKCPKMHDTAQFNHRKKIYA
jgi:hypothetical protein